MCFFDGIVLSNVNVNQAAIINVFVVVVLHRSQRKLYLFHTVIHTNNIFALAQCLKCILWILSNKNKNTSLLRNTSIIIIKIKIHFNEKSYKYLKGLVNYAFINEKYLNYFWRTMHVHLMLTLGDPPCKFSSLSNKIALWTYFL